MRGPDTLSPRSLRQSRTVNQAIAVARPAFPAPYNGWNARGNLANMSPVEAIIMDDIFPGVQDVSLRKGSITWATGFGSNVRSVIPYSGASDKLFAVIATAFYDITASGAIGASVASCTNPFWSYVNFANSGGRWLCLCNGVDAYKTFDGTTWATPAITGVSGADLNYITAHQRRLWFIEKNTMNLWYLGTEAISGAATKFPVGAIFKKGGYLVAIGSWTVDSGAGKDDLFVIITSNGEIAVYGGIDPSSITTWSLIGIYDAARPLGPRPLVDYGGDLLYLSMIGLVPMTKITQANLLNATDEISYKIDGAFLAAADNYKSNFGWQMVTHKAHNMLIVNIPVSSDALSYQFIMNTITKAWCRFTNWNASCWAVLGDDIYFGGGDKVYRAWTGNNDSGAPIVGRAAQAYSNLGISGQKMITLIRPNIAFSQNVNVQMALDADFRAFSDKTEINYTPATGAGVWDSSLWDSGLWDAGQQTLNPKWLTVPGDLGYLHSFRMQLTSSLANVTWTSTDFIGMPAGLI